MSEPSRLTHPTSYPEVNAVLKALLAEVEEILGEHLVGMYLYGSLAGGDFDPERSDVDFVVVTDGELPADIIEALAAMHRRIAIGGSRWAAKLEGAYVPKALIRRHDPDAGPCLTLNEGHFYMAPLGSDWVIQRHLLREQGGVVAGPDPRSLIDPVGPGALREAVLGFLREWWAPMLDDPDPRLQGGEYQSYAVVTLCRALYTLRHGAILSKTEAARWGEETLDQRWRALIAWASAWRPGGGARDVREILGFLRYAILRMKDEG